jgi:predicted transcriptional regulator
MDPNDILALAARHYSILNCLRHKDYDYTELVQATKISRATLDNYIGEMAEAGLVEQKKKRNKYILYIMRKGLITLNYIDKYEKLLFEPKLSEEIKPAVSEILDYANRGYQNRRLEELLPRKLSLLCHEKPEVIFNSKLQEFFVEYLNKLVSIYEIDQIIIRYIRDIIDNSLLSDWFYRNLYPIIVEQFHGVGFGERIRMTRVPFLWEVFEKDETRREEILNHFIAVLNGECIGKDLELCRFICGSYPRTVEDDLIKRLIKMGDNRILDKFFHQS